MLYGYLNLGRWLEIARNEDEKLQPANVFKNGYDLSKIFLGSANDLTNSFRNLHKNPKQRLPAHSQEGINHSSSSIFKTGPVRPRSEEPQQDHSDMFNERKLKKFIIKSNSNTVFTPRTADKTAKNDQEAENSIIHSSRREKVKVSLPSSRTQSVSENYQKHSNRSLSIDTIHNNNIQLTRVNTPVEINIDKIMEEKIEQSLKKMHNEEFDLAKFQRKIELDFELKQLQKDIEAARAKKEKKMKKIEALNLKTKALGNFGSENTLSPNQRPMPVYMPFYPMPFGTMQSMPMNYQFSGMAPERPNRSVSRNNSINNEEDNGTGSQGSLKSIDANSIMRKGSSLNGSQSDMSAKFERSELSNSNPKKQEARSRTSSAEFGHVMQSNPLISTSQTNDVSAELTQSRRLLIEDAQPGPISKAETFGAGALGQLIGEFKKMGAAKRASAASSRADISASGLETINEKNHTYSTAGTTHTNIGETSTTKGEINFHNRTSNNFHSLLLGPENSNYNVLGEEKTHHNVSHNEKTSQSIIFKDTIIHEDPRLKETGRSKDTSIITKEPENTSKLAIVKKNGPLVKKDSINLSIDGRFPNVANRIFPSISKIDFEFLDETAKQEFVSPRDWQNSEQDSIAHQRSSFIFEFLDHVGTLENTMVRQIYVGIKDENEYTLECHFISQYIDPKIRIVLNQRCPGQRTFVAIAEENIKLKDLKVILQYIEYRDVIPASLPIKCLRDYGKLINYFVLPFVWVRILIYLNNVPTSSCQSRSQKEKTIRRRLRFEQKQEDCLLSYMTSLF